MEPWGYLDCLSRQERQALWILVQRLDNCSEYFPRCQVYYLSSYQELLPRVYLVARVGRPINPPFPFPSLLSPPPLLTPLTGTSSEERQRLLAEGDGEAWEGEGVEIGEDQPVLIATSSLEVHPTPHPQFPPSNPLPPLPQPPAQLGARYAEPPPAYTPKVRGWNVLLHNYCILGRPCMCSGVVPNFP